MKLILYQATMAITEIDFVPGPFRCQIEQQHLDFAVAYGIGFLDYLLFTLFGKSVPLICTK